MVNEVSLLENPIRVSTPFIKVTFGDKNSGESYTFGVTREWEDTSHGTKRLKSFQYPNYIQSLQVVKINGQVNQYTLVIKYPITQDSDPNYFEKIFSSVSKSRKITFSYGDLAAPKMVYREEEAIILKIENQFDINSAVIQYNISAVSSCRLSLSGGFNFVTSEFTGPHQPSSIIKKILRDPKYGLQDVFSGMRNMDLVESRGLIYSNDNIVNLNAKENISVLDYLYYLVRSMCNPNPTSLFTMVVVDETSDEFGGPYFKVVEASRYSTALDTYVLEIGYPSSNVVTSFTIDNNESYSLLYDFSKRINTNEYITRINDAGEEESIYSPNITSINEEQVTHADDTNWWKNVTEYPIKASITLKGLLRPALLMSKLRLTVLFYGHEHISSGEYIITKQTDHIDSNGCWTTLNLVRVGGAG